MVTVGSGGNGHVKYPRWKYIRFAVLFFIALVLAGAVYGVVTLRRPPAAPSYKAVVGMQDLTEAQRQENARLAKAYKGANGVFVSRSEAGKQFIMTRGTDGSALELSYDETTKVYRGVGYAPAKWDDVTTGTKIMVTYTSDTNVLQEVVIWQTE